MIREYPKKFRKYISIKRMPAGRPKSKLRLLMEKLIEKNDPLVSRRVYIKSMDEFLKKNATVSKSEFRIYHEKLLNRIRFNLYEIKKKKNKLT